MEQQKLLKQLIAAVFILLFFTMWLIGRQTSSFDKLEVEHTIERSRTCSTGGKGSMKDFVLFLHDANIATQLMTLYCQDKVIAKQFAKRNRILGRRATLQACYMWVKALLL